MNDVTITTLKNRVLKILCSVSLIYGVPYKPYCVYFSDMAMKKIYVHVTAPSDFDDDPLADILPDNTTSSGESKTLPDPVRGQKTTTANSAVTKQPFVDEGMDLFPTKGSREPRSTSSSKSDFMSELFGEKKVTSSAAKSQAAGLLSAAAAVSASTSASPGSWQLGSGSLISAGP